MVEGRGAQSDSLERYRSRRVFLLRLRLVTAIQRPVVKNAIAHQGASTLNATLGREDEIVNVEIEIEYDRVASESLRLVPCRKSNGGVLKNAAVPTPELPAFVAEALRRASAQAGRPFVMLTYRSLSDLGNRERKSG
jgi:hypothetical protein